MDVQLKEKRAPRPPDKPQNEKHMSDFRRKRVRPVPNQVIPDICPPVVVQETNPKQQLNRPTKPQPKLITCVNANVNEILKKRDHRGFSRKLLHRYACSMLECLQVLHDKKVVHGDLKPDKILMMDEERSGVKVADFGSGSFEDEQVFSDKGTCWYRAPELLLHQPSTTTTDMWSLGCLLAELHTGRPIFRGKNELDQLSCIMEVLGMPSIVEREKSDFWAAFFACKWKRQTVGKTTGIRHPKSRPLVSVLGTTDYAFLDFVQRCLTWDPKMRMTPQEAMQHKWIMKSRCYKPQRVYDLQWFESKDGTGEPSFPKPPVKKGQHEAFCEERLGCKQNMYNSSKIPILKPSVKRSP